MSVRFGLLYRGSGQRGRGRQRVEWDGSWVVRELGCGQRQLGFKQADCVGRSTCSDYGCGSRSSGLGGMSLTEQCEGFEVLGCHLVRR